MASEKKIREVLNLLTTVPGFQIESLDAPANAHASSLRNLARTKNIVALGIAEKVSRERGTGVLALTFYVKKKVPLSELMADEAIPATIPSVLTGIIAVPTDVVVLGDIVLQTNFTRTPIQAGNSISHSNATAGTLGAVVTKGKKYFALSNSHVLAKNGAAQKGDSVVYPGKSDGGNDPADQLGKLTDFVPFITGAEYLNKTDCAIAEILPERHPEIVAEIMGKGLPKGTIKPKRGMKVFKVGRTSNYTEAEIKDADLQVSVPYGGDLGDIRFINQVLCTQFTEQGDSGALVIDKESGKAVGLHFCGGSRGSIFNPINFVLAALKVKLLTKEISKLKKVK